MPLWGYLGSLPLEGDPESCAAWRARHPTKLDYGPCFVCAVEGVYIFVPVRFDIEFISAFWVCKMVGCFAAEGEEA